MEIVERRIGDVTILRLKGRLELDDGDVILRNHVDGLMAQGHVNVVLDLTDVTRMDSAGIGMLVGKYMTVKNRGGMLRLLHLTERTSRLLHVTRLETVFEIFEDEDAALKSFKS
ncbi:MAG: STAS domain-containing protein [Candidatus Limnocylindrales bacterium]